MESIVEPAGGSESQLLRSSLKFLNNSDSHGGACRGVARQTAASPVEVDSKVPQEVATAKPLRRLSLFFPVWCNLSEDWQQLQENCFRYLLIF